MLEKMNWILPNGENLLELFKNNVVNAVLIFNDKGIVNSINPAFTTSFGYREEDILGKHFSILFTDWDQQNGMPEKELYQVLSKSQSSDNNYIVLKNGSLCWVSGESIAIKSSSGNIVIIKIIQNIQEQKEAEERLQRINGLNEEILGAIKDMVVVVDGELNILKTNKEFEEFTEKKRQEISKDLFLDLIRPYDLKGELQEAIQKAVANKHPFTNFSIEMKAATGERKAFNVSASPMPELGGETNLLLVLQDITVFKQLERAREDLIGFIAHELRNPLSNLVLCTDLMGELIKENMLKETTDMLDRTKRNIHRLNKMIAELYSAAKFNATSVKLEISEFVFEDMIWESIEAIQGLQPDYKITVKGNGNIVVKADRYRIMEVVSNYLSNGIKYSNGNKDITLSMSVSDGSIIVSVKDEGLGISPQEVPYVFERYFRAEQSRSLEGLGLGLYLCRRIILEHQGKVWVESEMGKGAIFYFSIPL